MTIAEETSWEGEAKGQEAASNLALFDLIHLTPP